MPYIIPEDRQKYFDAHIDKLVKQLILCSIEGGTNTSGKTE